MSFSGICLYGKVEYNLDNWPLDAMAKLSQSLRVEFRITPHERAILNNYLGRVRKHSKITASILFRSFINHDLTEYYQLPASRLPQRLPPEE